MSARLRAAAFLAAATFLALATAISFTAMHNPEPIVAGPGVSARRMLSDFASALARTPADTSVYVLEGKAPGGTLLLIGGTHPQELSGTIAAVLVIENLRVTKGRVVVIAHANQSGFSHTEPLEAFPHAYTIDTPAGRRWFRNGMRLTNPVHQWPDPDVYVHHPTGEPMVGLEARNLNRNYPGRTDGRYTERLAAAIMKLAREIKADMVIDMHEAYPEYPIINMIVAHERAFEIASLTQLSLQARGVPMNLMASPKNLHGLSHREFGDGTLAYAMLYETANPAMGRFRGRTDETLLVEGRDANYVRAAALKRLFVPFTEGGHPLSQRVARQLATLEESLAAYNEVSAERPIEVEDLPDYDAVRSKGIGAFLKPPPR